VRKSISESGSDNLISTQIFARIPQRDAEPLHAAPIVDAEVRVHDANEDRIMWRRPFDDQARIRLS
jgi:hypothetical protein